MKFYVAGKATESHSTADVIKVLQEAGHEITFNWPEFPNLKPYEQNQERAIDFAERALESASKADVFILLFHEDGKGLFVELGAALNEWVRSEKPKVYVVGPDQARSMMNYHPGVNWRLSVEEVFKELGI